MIQSLKDLAEGVRGSQGTITVSRAQADYLGIDPDGSLTVQCEHLVEFCDNWEDPKSKVKKKKKTDDDKNDKK